MVEELFKQFPERRTDWPTQNMLGRLSAPSEYRGAGVFLISDASSFMVGCSCLTRQSGSLTLVDGSRSKNGWWAFGLVDFSSGSVEELSVRGAASSIVCMQRDGAYAGRDWDGGGNDG